MLDARTTLLAALAFVSGLAGLGAAAPPAAAQQRSSASAPPAQERGTPRDEWFDPQFGRSTILRPEFTDRGEWKGTWFYANRDVRVMFWLREDDSGKPEFRLQLFNMSAPEQFTTDWNGKATYDVEGNPGRFSLTPIEVGPDLIRARWEWEVVFVDSARRETADVTIRRTGDGRRFAMTFEPVRREIERFGETSTYEYAQVWTFSKASKRQIIWDELF